MTTRLNRAWIRLGLSALLAACATTAPVQQAGSPVQTLWIGMYPYVPRLQQMEDALNAAWKSRHPDIQLKFFTDQQWDGGYNLPVPTNADLFVFDAVLFNDYRTKGQLLPLNPAEVQNPNDFLAYAIRPVQVGGQYYAIPLLGCTDILYYWQWDQALASATTLSAISSALGQCPYTSTVPPNPNGLMMDLAGKSTNACMYISNTERLRNIWPVPQPSQPSDVYPPAIDNMRGLLQMSSYLNAGKDQEPPYVRASWFSQGHGRALIAFTESMSAMSPDTLTKIGFKVMPLSDNSSPPLFYSDMIGINAKNYSPDKRVLLVELANLLASTDVMVAGTGPDASGMPQYLMPTRPSVFQALGQRFPIYSRMQSLVNGANPILFTLDNDAKAWMAAMGPQIRSMTLKGFACGCDFPAGPIWNQQDAQNKCPAACSTHRGWNGQWVTTTPGQASSCGCNACDIPQ